MTSKVVHVAFYPSDWEAGTAELDVVERGVYISLIARMYSAGGFIENNPKRLQRVCGCKSVAQLKDALQYLIAHGKIDLVDGLLTNRRVREELQKVEEKSVKAKQAVNQRWQSENTEKPNKSNKCGDTHVLQTNIRTQYYPEPELEKKDNTNVLSKKTNPRGSRLPDDWLLPKAWGEWAVNQGFSDDQVRQEADKFKDYWVGLSGQRATKRDWQATWRNWIRNAAPVQSRGSSRPQRSQPKTIGGMSMADIERLAGMT